MGFILSKFRKAKPSLEDSLEAVDKELSDIRKFQIDTDLTQKRLIGRLTIFAFITYAVGIAAYYLFLHTDTLSWAQLTLSLLPFLIFPLVIWSIRRLLSWWYERKSISNREKVNSLRKERERLLEEVMEKETFKTAKKILEKYAPSQLLPKYLAEQQRLLPGAPGTSSYLRRRTMGGPSVTPQQFGGGPRPYRGVPPQQLFGRVPRHPIQAAAAIMPAPRPGMPMFRAPLMLPSSQKTGWFEKLTDYVIGDGPNYKYALICRYCYTHNGLVSLEDLPYTAFRCMACRQVNPSKEQRPAAPTLPQNTVLIEEMNASRRESEFGEGAVVTEGDDEESSTKESEAVSSCKEEDDEGQDTAAEGDEGQGTAAEGDEAQDTAAEGDEAQDTAAEGDKGQGTVAEEEDKKKGDDYDTTSTKENAATLEDTANNSRASMYLSNQQPPANLNDSSESDSILNALGGKAPRPSIFLQNQQPPANLNDSSDSVHNN